MAVVQAQVQVDDQDPSTPVLLFTATAPCVVNVFCKNPDSVAHRAFVETRLQDAAQSPEQLDVPGTLVPAMDRIVEGPLYLAAGDVLYVYGEHEDQTFSVYGTTL